MKTCSKCQETKTLDLFYKVNENIANKQSQKDGHDYYCKYCRNGANIKSHHNVNKKPCSVSLCEKPHYAKGMCRNHYTRMTRNGQLEHKNKTVIDGKIYKYGNIKVTYERKSNIKRKYKLDYDTYLEMAKDGCHICGEFTERHLQVDHDHACCSTEITCGKCVRGIVCNRCNQTLGKYDTGKIRLDNPIYDKVKEYIDEYNAK